MRIGFFLSFRNEVIKAYDGLFVERDDSRSTLPSREQVFGAKWGWYQSLYALAGGDVTKFEQITKEPINKCLTWLTFEKEKNELEEKRIRDAHNKNTI